jgi:hypothetical protein
MRLHALSEVAVGKEVTLKQFLKDVFLNNLFYPLPSRFHKLDLGQMQTNKPIARNPNNG